MPKKSKKNMMKQLRKAANPGRAALMGAIGGAVVMFLGRDRLVSAADQFRARAGAQPHPAE